MNKEEQFEITMQTKAEKELLDAALQEIWSFPESIATWNDVFILHGAISGALNRYQSLPREKA